MTNQNSPVNPALSRRSFLVTTAAAGAAAAVNFPSVLAQAKPEMNAVILGVGGRGGGAGENFLEASKKAGVTGKILATADLFPGQAARGKQFGVPDDKCFSGFDAFQKALAVPGVNYAILAAPPGFRPPHFKACVEAGKNVFMEKPVCVDGPGAKIMYEAGKKSKEKGLKVAAGTQRRHEGSYLETIKRIHDGAIGDVVALRAYWVNGGPIWHRGSNGQSELEIQINNWYHYIWLSGDHICEQHVHNLDVTNWVMKTHPVKAWGCGARQMLGAKPGEIWDNFAVEFEYPNGVRCASYCGQITRKWASVSEAVVGTKGWSNASNAIFPTGGKAERFKTQENPYVQEHIDLINAIVKGTDLNEAEQVTDSTLTAIMGREAAYSGGEVTWDDIVGSTFKYGPEQLYTDAGAMKFGPFRTLKPPMPSLFNIFAKPPQTPLAS